MHLSPVPVTAPVMLKFFPEQGQGTNPNSGTLPWGEPALFPFLFKFPGRQDDIYIKGVAFRQEPEVGHAL